MKSESGQVSIMISNKLSKEAKREGINLRLVAEAAIKRAMEKREFLKKANRLLKNSKLTQEDAIKLGRRVNAALARRYAVR
jgi:hypothetical protein